MALRYSTFSNRGFSKHAPGRIAAQRPNKLDKWVQQDQGRVPFYEEHVAMGLARTRYECIDELTELGTRTVL